MCERSWLVRVPGTGAGPGEGAGLLLELQTKVHTKFRNLALSHFISYANQKLTRPSLMTFASVSTFTSIYR